MLESTRGEKVLNIGLSSKKEFVDNVNICEPQRCSGHNQIYFIITTMGEWNIKIRYRNFFHIGRSNLQTVRKTNTISLG